MVNISHYLYSIHYYAQLTSHDQPIMPPYRIAHILVMGIYFGYSPNYSIKKIPTLPDFSSLDRTVCYTVSATWECLEHSACVTESLVDFISLRYVYKTLSLIWHTKVNAKSDWSVKTYIKANHNTITPFASR